VNYRTQTLADGLAFPEGPRWHDGRLWFTDQHARTVCTVTPDGELSVVAQTSDLPGGLGWLPDGTLLVVHMTERRIMQLHDGRLREYADLSALASFHCNDMVVDNKGRVYAGNFGFDLHGGADITNAELILVDTDRRAHMLTDKVTFPNGSAITPDGRKLLVAETFAHRISAFELAPDGGLLSQTVWAELPRHTPDGICLDQEGSLWVASPGNGTLIRVKQGGAIVDRCESTGTPYACMLGGPDRRTLYVCTSESDDPDEAAKLRSGRIEQVRVLNGGAGLP
jgi:sugar lactone lactonase YvrE